MNQKKGVFSLNFSRSKITSIPNEVMKNKDSLIQLDVSGNNFTDFHSVLEDLKQLQKLKKLRINIYTQEQAKDIIDSMPNLEYLNDEPINEEIPSEEENINEYKEEEYEDDEEEVIINIPLVKLVDKTFDPIFIKLKEFYDMNKTREEEFQRIIIDFNNFGKKINIRQNKFENLTIADINNKLELYKFLNNKLNKIKDEINSKNNKYNPNSILLLLKIIEENDKIKNKCNLMLLNQQTVTKNLLNRENNGKKLEINKNIQKHNINQGNKNNNLNKINHKNDLSDYKYYNQLNSYSTTDQEKNNYIQKSKNISKKTSSPTNQHNLKKNMFTSNKTHTEKNSNEFPRTNRSFNKINERIGSPKTSERKTISKSTLSERRSPKRNYGLNHKIKKYSKQANLIENYNDPSITNLLIKEKSNFDPINIFDDENNEQIYKDKLNTRIINLNNLLEIINQIYKVRNSRIEKQKQEKGIYNKATLEQDLYTYLKSKYGLKKLIIEWNINILSSIQSYFKLNGEVYLFALILRNELDEDSIEIVNKIKKTVNNILYLIYDYDLNLVENIKKNKDFLRESEWKTISKCLYSDDNQLRQKFLNKVSNFIGDIMKGQELVAKTGQKILFSDYMNLLISFNLKLRKKYLHNLFVLFSKCDKKRTGIINLKNFKSIIKNCGIISDEQRAEEVADDLIEIADKDGSGQITFNDTVQCLDNLDLIMNEGKIKFLDKLSKMNLKDVCIEN